MWCDISNFGSRLPDSEEGTYKVKYFCLFNGILYF